MVFLGIYIIVGLLWTMIIYVTVLNLSKVPVGKMSPQMRQALENTAYVLDRVGWGGYLLLVFFIWPVTLLGFFVGTIRGILR